ncbi:hypothetical protein [Nonomuraea sp. NPDC049400]|uniref:hypothetical protein n=1 Tax=Nonomuraea sp. NPDC049400 TaxID=3364352 RepID=UPI0037A36F86
MTPRHALPEEHQQALSAASQLVDLLALRHNIPANAQTLPCGVVVRVFTGLVVHVDQVIWWTVPDMTGARRQPLVTYAHSVEGAATRLAEAYTAIRTISIAELLAKGLITPLSTTLVTETDTRRAAAPR